MPRLFIFITIIFLGLISCSHHSKDLRDQAQYRPPEFKIPNDWRPQQFTQKRAPATLETKLEQDVSKYSSKRLYFLGLYTQWSKLNQLLGQQQENKDLRVCPVFHHDLLTLNSAAQESENQVNVIGLTPADSINQEQWYLFPEYHLFSTHKTKVDFASWKSELTNYNAKIKRELKELCEYGQSQNYYIYVNYLRHLKRHPEFARDAKAIKSVLKIPVMANIYLLSPLMSHRGANFHFSSFDKEMIKRLQVEWIDGMLYNIVERRYSLKKENQFVLKD